MSALRAGLLVVALALGSATSLQAAPPTSPAAQGEVLEAAMAGEFALQAGQLDEATRWYLAAARAAEGDAGLAERATWIALLANDDQAATDALALWQRRAPQSLSMRSAQASLALRQGDASQARSALFALMRSKADVDDRPVEQAASGNADTGLVDTDEQGPDDDADNAASGWHHALNVLGGGQNPDLAARLLEELVDADVIPGQLQAWAAFGRLAQQLDRPELAERIIAEVVEHFPGEPRVALLRASQLREAGKPEQARQVLAGLQQAITEQPALRRAVAAEYDALGDPVAAAAILAHGPQDDYSYGMRAALLAQAKDNDRLEALYRELKRGSAKPDPQRRLLLGQVAEFLERHEAALTWYRSVPGGPQRWRARLRAAKVLHELERGAQAYAELHALQDDAQARQDARRDAYLLEAELHHRDDADAAEMDAYARGLAAYPDDAALLYSRALAWERRDDIARAEADLRKILVAEPDNVAALNALGYTLADRTTRYTEALELINRARAAEPDNAAIIDSYGWVLYRLDRPEDALVELRRAFSLQEDAEIAAHVGEVLWVLGKPEQAREYFRKAREIDPDNRALQRALDKTGA